MESLMKTSLEEVPTYSIEEWERLLDEKERLLSNMQAQNEIINNLRKKCLPLGEISEEDEEILFQAMATYEKLDQEYLALEHI